jgi:hypothetical protein
MSKPFTTHDTEKHSGNQSSLPLCPSVVSLARVWYPREFAGSIHTVSLTRNYGTTR